MSDAAARPSITTTAGAIILAALLASCAGTAYRDDDHPPARIVDRSAVTAIDPGSKLSAGWQHGAFIEIFVRAWRDSDGDGLGDLRGVTQSLDYLRDLGIRGIWLMPITQSADHDHGYAVTDFRTLEPAYGTLADFDELVREAHARGIGVIMDYVINHSATSHPLFVEAASRTSPDRDWYIWKEPAPTGWEIWGKNPWHASSGGTYYGTFGPHMPDFNLENPAVIDYHRDSLKFWLNRGLDGFRFDAVSHLIERSATDWRDQPESFALMGRVNALMGSYKHRYMVCEGTANPIRWAAPDACRSAFAFGLQYHIADAARGRPEAVRAVADYFTTAPMTMATMVSNHDFFAGERLWDQVNGSTAQYRLAAASYLLLPGTPFIYYGEEIGMAGVSELKGDIKLRTPMSWTADASGSGAFTTGKPFRPVSPNAATQNVRAALADPNSILSFYKAMLHLRNTLPSIARGSYEHPTVDSSVMSYQRKFEGDHTLVVINYGTTAATAKIGALPIGATLIAAYPAIAFAATADAKGATSIAIDAQSVRVFSVRL